MAANQGRLIIFRADKTNFVQKGTCIVHHINTVIFVPEKVIVPKNVGSMEETLHGLVHGRRLWDV